MSQYSNIHVGSVPPPVAPPANMNPQQQVFQMIDKAVVDRVQPLASTVSEMLGRVESVEKYLGAVLQKYAEEEAIKSGDIFTRDEKRLLTLHQAGVVSKEEVRKHLPEFSEEEAPKKKGRPRKEETVDEQG